ncbi:MAG TPA: phosphate/phosphite/phosphonate ABC transporter substrate-binding protein [Candidatus Thermoplasmatota archaeon]|nr:phosphate/phosphite/phosphonate ABC transporter substrate-binding protein [Candidatus Thermoplasmatota archaeon]
MPKLFATMLLTAAFLAGCSAAPAALTGSSGQDLPVVTLAIQPTESADVITAKAPALEAFLEARMAAHGTPADVRVYVPTAYISVVDALRFGHADAAMMSAWPMALASAKAGADVVLAEQREVMHGEAAVTAPHYFSYYVVRADSPHTTLEDLRGKSVAFPSRSSTSGYIFPVAKLVQEGLVPAPAKGEADPRQFFGEVRIAGGYAQAWEALRSGQVDVAVTAGDINAQLFQEVLAGTRVIATQGPVPSHGVVFADGFAATPEGEALRLAMLDLKGEHRDLMRSLVSGIFVEFAPATETHIAGLSDALRLTGVKLTESA